MSRLGFLATMFLLLLLAFCLMGSQLCRQSDTFFSFEIKIVQLAWPILLCLSVWIGCLLILTFHPSNLPLIIFLSVAFAACLSNGVQCPGFEVNTLFACVAIAKGSGFLLDTERINYKKRRTLLLGSDERAIDPNRCSAGRVGGKYGRMRFNRKFFLIGLMVMLSALSFWHTDMRDNISHGPRWVGIWGNPNTYGMLMGTGLVMNAGLIMGYWNVESIGNGVRNWRTKSPMPPWLLLLIVFFIATGTIGMMIGLVCSYSRGAWLGTVLGLLYLAKAQGRLKWRWVLAGILIVATVLTIFWNATSDSAPWYVKRLDFSRPSAQHRVIAWVGALKIMRDYPFGVGWGRAVKVYAMHYSAPKNGEVAITTNDYFMLGTQLGLPALFCFIVYAYLKFEPKAADSLPVACRAGALVLLVAFWFDGGLFDLPTAAVFWILLELGTDSVNFTARTVQQRFSG